LLPASAAFVLGLLFDPHGRRHIFLRNVGYHFLDYTALPEDITLIILLFISFYGLFSLWLMALGINRALQTTV
jgi:hypothetical protein